jgi:hypothetical protein
MKTNRLAIIFVTLLILLLIASGLTNPVLQPISITSLTEKDGFWPLEFSGDRYYRWTKGSALFHLPGFETASSLYVILNLTAPQYLGAAPIDAWMQIDGSPAIRFSIAPEWRRYYILTSVTEPRWHTPLLKLVTDTWTPGIHDQRQLGVAVSEGTIQRINSPRLFAVLERALFLAVLTALFYATMRYLQPFGSLLTVFAIVILGIIGTWVPSRFAQVLPTNWSLVSEILVAAVAVEVVRLRRKISHNLLYIIAMTGVVTGALFISVLGWIIAGVVFIICGMLSAIVFADETHKSRFLYPLMLTLVFYSFSVLTLVYWHQNERYDVTGDEPHYLVMADGIISFGTFEQTKPYKKELEERNIWRAELLLDPHVIDGPNGSYNVHNIGLPLLISVPYKLGSDISNILPPLGDYNVYGIGSVKLFLITTAGLIVIGSWILSGFFSFLNNIKVRAITVLAIVYGYPFVPASSQVYPEFTAGIILLFATIYLILN